MTDEERKALVERLRWGHWYFDDPFDGKAYASDDPLEAADQIEADGQRIAELEAALIEIRGYSEVNGMTRQRMKRIARAALGNTHD